MQHVTKLTSELQVGDIVRCHGMRCLIDREVEISRGHGDTPGVGDGKTRYVKALVLNRDEVSTAVVPYSFTADWDSYPSVNRSTPLPHHGEHRWTIQGNDRATWAVEA
jgi:hypothetical protein